MRRRTRRSKWKTVTKGGISITSGNSSLARKLLKSTLRARADRKAREQAYAARPKPKLDLGPSLVAFVDILGFGHEVERAKTVDELLACHRKIETVQRNFLKASVALEPQQTADLNRHYGYRVLALSDAVVVAITPHAPASLDMGSYDMIGFALLGFVIAQTACLSDGIFLRGGIGWGPFSFENDILLSPALVHAYTLENNHAKNPVIVLTESTRQSILGLSNKKEYADGADPTPTYFARYGNRRFKRERMYFLDYVGIMIHEQHRGLLPEDKKALKQARAHHDLGIGQEIWSNVHYKDAAWFLEGHRLQLEAAYRAATSEKVRDKYRWLMKYHNRSFRHDLPFIRDQVIDLSAFQNRTVMAQ